MDFRASAPMFVGLIYLTVIAFAIVVSSIFQTEFLVLT